MPPIHQPLYQPLPGLGAWTDAFRDAPIPVLAHTADVIALLRSDEDAADARTLAEAIGNDPLMALKVLALASAKRAARVAGDPETVVAALLMIGTAAFFRSCDELPTVESRLGSDSEAMCGLRAVLRRSHRAARFALAFAVHRLDHDAAVIHLAALLHDFAELLLWCHAPALALRLQSRQAVQPGLRSHVAQRQSLGIELVDLQQSLMKAWRLPGLLVRISDDRHADHPQVLTVKLAIQLARHTANDWDNAALPDDVAAIARLLNLGIEPTLALLHDIDS